MSSLPESTQLPKLSRDRAFWGLTITQFLGAFNDNLFKQLVLLICVDVSLQSGHNYQTYAQAIFAIPFVLFSGLAGWLSDRYSKRFIVVLAKVAEIGIMLAGMAVFLGGSTAEPESLVAPLFVVLGWMSLQSAFFGPPKYGILPELFRSGDLPNVNGIVQMTTFLAIIFGMALAGIGKQLLGDGLWKLSAVCVGLAVAGTLTSLLIRKTPIAQPGLPFEKSMLAIHHSLFNVLKRDRLLRGALLISSLFWFVGGVVQPAANELGKNRLQLGDGRTSVALAWMATGIAFGCVAAARLSKHRINFRLVTAGAWGMIGALLLVTLIGETAPVRAAADAPVAIESVSAMLVSAAPREWALRLALTAVGFCGGLFIVPLQVLIQVRPPAELKGRMIGAMNLANWIGIVCSAFFFGVCAATLAGLGKAAGLTFVPVGWIFALLAGVLLPVGLFYRPRLETPAAEATPAA